MSEVGADNKPDTVPVMADAPVPESRSENVVFDAAQGLHKLGEQRPGTTSDISIALGLGGNPALQKINETHITQSLNLAIQTNQNDFLLKQKQQEIDAQQADKIRGLHTLVYIGYFEINRRHLALCLVPSVV
jgi:hypothetical protein